MDHRLDALASVGMLFPCLCRRAPHRFQSASHRDADATEKVAATCAPAHDLLLRSSDFRSAAFLVRCSRPKCTEETIVTKIAAPEVRASLRGVLLFWIVPILDYVSAVAKLPKKP